MNANNEQGQSAVEQAFLLALVAAVIVGVFSLAPLHFVSQDLKTVIQALDAASRHDTAALTSGLTILAEDAGSGEGGPGDNGSDPPSAEQFIVAILSGTVFYAIGYIALNIVDSRRRAKRP
jgi:Flp pilus assembly pilin Flp